MRLILAIRVFFAVLFRAELARRVERLLGPEAEEPPPTAAPKAAAEPSPRAAPKAASAPPPGRSEALSLLAALQREARFVDLVLEPLGSYGDAQIGAAARDVLRDCAAVLERMFDLERVLAEEEGAAVEVPEGFDPGRFRLTGNVTGQPPFRGQLVHHGWQATRCELPRWTGSQDAARIVAAAEVELK